MANYQTNLPCAACGDCVNQRTFHHVITRGARPDLAEACWNKMPLDAKHHTMIHARGLNYMSEKYPRIEKWLIANGWEFDDYRNKWTHPSASVAESGNELL